MDIGVVVSIVIYFIFFLMTLVYFYLFNLYFSLIPTFICIYLLINYHHYQPVEGAWTLAILMFVSLISFMLYWIIYSILNRKE